MYCRHALLRMARARISSDEVQTIIEYPAWRRRSYGGRVEYHGYADNRRHLRVVLESDGCTVVTVVVEPFR